MDFLSAAEIDHLLLDQLRPRLPDFEPVTPRKWVRAARAPIREMFLIQSMNPIMFCAIWGVSLDYVPHLSGSSLRWHRTSKSALFDLNYDPLDYTAETAGWVATSAAEIAALLEKTVPLAFGFWTSTADLLAAFAEKERRPFVRFGFHNYVQQGLAYAFTLARAGRTEEARERLEGLLKTHEHLSCVAADLRARLSASA